MRGKQQMNETNLKQIIAKNITYYRKQIGWTQLELAEQLNYSDKSVSKWERAEGLPDIVVLTTMAELFGITVNDLLQKDEPTPPVQEEKTSLSTQSRITVLLLSAGLAFFVAAFVFFICKLVVPDMSNAWYAFIAVLPVCAVIAVVFSCLWWDWLVRCISISALVWTLALCVDIMLANRNSFLIYIVAAVFQVLIVLWYFLMTKPGEKKSQPEETTE